MNIVVIGGAGLVGSKLVSNLREQGRDVAAPSEWPEGSELAGILAGAAVVVDVSAPRSIEDEAFVEFTSFTRRLLEEEAAAGVSHHVALSAVGTERLLESSYFRARCAQEKLIEGSSIPYSIVRATQMFELLGCLADADTQASTVRVPPLLLQPIAADDVVRLMTAVAVNTPLNGIVELGGPEPFYLDGLVERLLGAHNDPRKVVPDPHARYFGAVVNGHSLVAGDEAQLGKCSAVRRRIR